MEFCKDAQTSISNYLLLNCPYIIHKSEIGGTLIKNKRI